MLGIRGILFWGISSPAPVGRLRACIVTLSGDDEERQEIRMKGWKIVVLQLPHQSMPPL
jgi:hypothetical protein